MTERLMHIVFCVLAGGLAGLTAPGCGSNACEDADARYEECGLGENESPSECSGEAECWASCVADADCDTLLGNGPPSADYQECISDCND